MRLTSFAISPANGEGHLLVFGLWLMTFSGILHCRVLSLEERILAGLGLPLTLRINGSRASEDRRLSVEDLVNRNIWTLLVLVLVLVASSNEQTSGSKGNSDSPNSEVKPPDLSKWLTLMVAAQGGGGLLSGGPTAYGGAKFGLGPGVLSLGYDRIQAHNGFSIDGSALLPVIRFPGPQKNETRNFVRIYAEPGVGNRTGSGQFGGYLSAKVMVALLSNKRLYGDTWEGSPFLEVERRFPFKAFGQGDTRIAFGFGYMLVLSDH